MPKPLAEVLAAVEVNAAMRKALGRYVLTDLCLQCPLSECKPVSSACAARRLISERKRQSYRRHADHRRAYSLAYYHAHSDEINERRTNAPRDPFDLAVKAAKARVKNAAKRAREGKPVRTFQWRTPERNQAWRKAQERA